MLGKRRVPPLELGESCLGSSGTRLGSCGACIGDGREARLALVSVTQLPNGVRKGVRNESILKK